ncbi:MAG: copper chaperone PCu(A)C [Pseudomonadota bacterium]
MTKRCLRFFLATLLLAMPMASYADLEVSNSWIKNLPPAMPMRAGYLSLYNPNDSTVTLVGATSERFGKIELHQSVAKDGVMSMEHVHHLMIKPGKTVKLEPGGYHLMLMKPKEPTEPGETIQVKLKFADGSEQEVDMQVRK